MSFLGAKLEIHFNDTVTNEMGLFKSRYVLCVTVYFRRETKKNKTTEIFLSGNHRQKLNIIGCSYNINRKTYHVLRPKVLFPNYLITLFCTLVGIWFVWFIFSNVSHDRHC